MLIKKWEKLPKNMQVEEVKPYYEMLRKKNFSLFLKRFFDIVVSAILLVILSPLFIIVSVLIKIDSKGPVFYRQERVTQYGKIFKIFKFRSMVNNADKKGALVTSNGDARVTKIGKIIRKLRIDEISQLIDVFRGTMTFVGTRPEVKKYVDAYLPEYKATLLLPAGVTSMASIYFKDEAELLKNCYDVDSQYIQEVLPQKMKYNLDELKKFNLFRDIKIMIMTVLAVIKR